MQTGVATCEATPPVGYRVVKVFDNGIETFTIYLPDPVDSVPLVNIVTAAVDPDTVGVNVPVSFTCVVDSANFPDWSGLSYKWKFGDGDSFTVPNSSHAYTDTGNYQVVFAAYKLHDKCALYRFNIVVKGGQYVQENTTKDFTSFSPTVIGGLLSLPQGKKCKVFDITGRIVMPDKIKPGIYFIEADGKITRKVVKVR